MEQNTNQPPQTPLVITTNLGRFLDKKNLKNQIEKRGNRGFVDPAFESLMRSKEVGWWDGASWCAFYVKLVLSQMYSFDREWVAKNLTGKAVNNLYVVGRLNNSGDKRYLAITSGAPQIGDVFIQQNTTGDRSFGHTGFVLDVFSGNNAITLEGNTSQRGVREGEGTFELRRNLTIGSVSGGKKVIGFIRRNFTQEELAKLTYNLEKETFEFSDENAILKYIKKILFL